MEEELTDLHDALPNAPMSTRYWATALGGGGQAFRGRHSRPAGTYGTLSVLWKRNSHYGQ